MYIHYTSLSLSLSLSPFDTPNEVHEFIDLVKEDSEEEMNWLKLSKNA